MKKCVIILLTTVLALALPGCGKAAARYDGLSDYVASYRRLGLLTGKDSPNRTEVYDVGGCDLGFPVYSSVTDSMYYFFGDTFSSPTQSGRWRSNTMGISKDFDGADGVTLDDFYKSSSGIAKAIVDGHHLDNYEVTKIPTGAVELNGTLYLFYMSIREWKNWRVNYNGVVSSSDGGENWRRVHDLTWVYSDEGLIADDTLILMNESVDMTPGEGNVTSEGRVAPNFGQIYPVLSPKDGYVYLFGIPGGRAGGVKLGRVRPENFENFEKIEYFTGRDADGQPIFVAGRDGLAAIRDSDEAYIIKDATAEPSVVYNDYLGKWMLFNIGMTARFADTPWGEWSDSQHLTDPSEVSGYGCIVVDKLSKERGRILYVIASVWMPDYNPYLVEITLQGGAP